MKKKKKKKITYSTNENSYSIFNTHLLPNNFYLNKQSAIIPNPTYKRTTYFYVFLKVNKLDCYPIQNWRHVRAIDSSPCHDSSLIFKSRWREKERERRKFIGPACRVTSVLCLQHTLHWIPNAIYRTVHLYCMTVSS